MWRTYKTRGTTVNGCQPAMEEFILMRQIPNYMVYLFEVTNTFRLSVGTSSPSLHLWSVVVLHVVSLLPHLDTLAVVAGPYVGRFFDGQWIHCTTQKG